MASRMERGPLADWWWTVDRALLVLFVMLMLFGILVSLAGSPPVAERLNYGTFHFVIRQMIFLVPAVIILVVTSFLSPRYVRRLALLVYVGAMALVVYALIYGVEIKGARRWINIIPIAGGRARIAGEYVREIFESNGFRAVGSVRSDHHHRARQTEFDDPHLCGKHWCDLAVAHHEHGRRGSPVDESLTTRKRAAEIGGGLACSHIITARDRASQQVRTHDIGGT